MCVSNARGSSATDEDRRAIAQWQGRSAQHAQAWQRAEAILGDFNSVPGEPRIVLAGEQAHEGVMGQVRRITGIAQLAIEPAVQPSVVFAVQRLDRQIERSRHADHPEPGSN